MKNTAFSLMTALLAVMNESEPKDPYYVLAQYFFGITSTSCGI